MLKFYARFEINDQTGDPLTDHDMMQLHYDRITALQKAAFVKYAELRRFALTNVASINTREALTKHFESLRYGMFFTLENFWRENNILHCNFPVRLYCKMSRLTSSYCHLQTIRIMMRKTNNSLWNSL